MSNRSHSPISDKLDSSSLDLSEGSCASDMDSDNSRDFNLNSKKFTDNNLFGDDVESINKIEENYLNFTSAIENLNTTYSMKCEQKERAETQSEKPGVTPDYERPTTAKPVRIYERPKKVEDNHSELENSNQLLEKRKNSIPVTTSSTPKPESADSQALANLFTISTETSPVEPGDEGQTYLVAKTALSKSVSLTSEEIGKKFQDLSFAFKTDSMTIQKRLQLMKRRRDQAESNIENELGIIKAKLKTLQYLGLNSDYVNLMTDLKNQLDFVLNATLQLSSSAECYGYAQHEERLLELIAVMLQHVENVESSNNDSSKASEKLKAESIRSAIARSPSSAFLDGAKDDDKILRRRSVVMQEGCRRRASIATLPRIGTSLENGCSGKGFQWATPNRSCGSVPKKLLFSQTSPKTSSNNLPGFEDHKDLIGPRHRKESRNSEGSMTNIDESPEKQSSVVTELVKEPIESECDSVSDSSLQLKQLFESIEEVRRNSGGEEHVTAAHCVRRIVDWNKLLFSSARFRWPENVLHYAPFFITWYIVFVLVLVFIGGLFTGISGCHAYSCLKQSALWLVVPAFLSFSRRFHRFLLLLFLSLVLALTVFFFWLTQVLLPRLSNEEVDSLFRTLGLEIRYLYGPPPV